MTLDRIAAELEREVADREAAAYQRGRDDALRDRLVQPSESPCSHDRALACLDCGMRIER